MTSPVERISAKFVEGKDRRFYGVEIVDGDFGHAVVADQREFHVGQFFSCHQASGYFGQRDAGGFAYVRNGARGAGVYFQHVDGVALDGVLHVHEADHFQCQGEALRVFTDGGEDLRREAHWRKDAAGIAGVHAGFLDVFHNAADDDVGAVGESVNVYLRGFFQELIDQHGFCRAHQRGLRDVLLHGVYIVGDDHGAAAQDVTGANQNWQADFSGYARGFFRD